MFLATSDASVINGRCQGFFTISIEPCHTVRTSRITSVSPGSIANIVVKGTAPDDLCPQINLAKPGEEFSVFPFFWSWKIKSQRRRSFLEVFFVFLDNVFDVSVTTFFISCFLSYKSNSNNTLDFGG